jgi:hypothetical protein
MTVRIDLAGIRVLRRRVQVFADSNHASPTTDLVLERRDRGAQYSGGMSRRRGRWTNRPLDAVARWRAKSQARADARVVEALPREPGIKDFARGANGLPSAVPARKRPRLYRATVELPPRLLGRIVPEPAPGWTPSPAWNAPLNIARLPTLIAGGDFIAGEPTTRGTVPAPEAWVYDQDSIVERQARRVTDHPCRCLADSTPTAGLGGHLVDDGHAQPRLEVCVYRYRDLPEGLQAVIDERAARRPRRRGRARQNPAGPSWVAWANDWFLADGTYITELLAADSRYR